MVRVHHNEGLANHIGPEPCVRVREGMGEASAGEHAGQPLSRERAIVPGADAVTKAEGNMTEAFTRAFRWPGVVRDPGLHKKLLVGNRKSVVRPQAPWAVWSASGRRGAEADDARAREVRSRHSMSIGVEYWLWREVGAADDESRVTPEA